MRPRGTTLLQPSDWLPTASGWSLLVKLFSSAVDSNPSISWDSARNPSAFNHLIYEDPDVHPGSFKQRPEHGSFPKGNFGFLGRGLKVPGHRSGWRSINARGTRHRLWAVTRLSPVLSKSGCLCHCKAEVDLIQCSARDPR